MTGGQCETLYWHGGGGGIQLFECSQALLTRLSGKFNNKKERHNLKIAALTAGG
jgi:hypothetical protein